VTAAVAAYFYLRVAVLMYAGGGLGEAEGGTTGSAELGVEGGMAGGSTIVAATGGDAGGDGGGASPEWATPAAVSGVVTTLNDQILLTAEDADGPSAIGEREPVPVLSGLAIAVCTGVTVLFGVWPQPLIDFANHATLLFLPK
jgi:hypothetical protein